MTKYYYHQTLSPSIKNPVSYNTVIDRTKSLFELPDIEILTPIGELCQSKTIEELCYDSTNNILNKAGTNKIVISWSGGIDSTLILSEFLKVTPKKQIVVLMNDNSILEYPEFYKKYIENQLEIKTIDFHKKDALVESIQDGVLVTGHIMDNLFGEPHNYQIMPKEKLNQKITEFLTEVNEQSREMYTKLIDACPRKILDVKDLFWWMNYTLSYQNEQLWVLLEIEEMILNKNLFHFSDTKDWNDYSVSTSAEEKYKGHEFNNFKMPLKEQLYKFTKDDYYTQNKIKVNSWRNYRTPQELIKTIPLFITTKWERAWK